MAPRFKVLKDDVDKARRELGIQDPVVVSITRYRYSTGRYIGHRDGQHRIGVDGSLDPRDASRAIWHELAHARQAEQLGGPDEFHREWWRQMRAAGINADQIKNGKWRVGRRYDRVALEREAKKAETKSRVRRLASKR